VWLAPGSPIDPQPRAAELAGARGQQTETLAPYKEHGVNPVAGCLPIRPQMPVWIALYRMLADAGELDQQPSMRSRRAASVPGSLANAGSSLRLHRGSAVARSTRPPRSEGARCD